MDIYASLSMCRKLVSYTCRKQASYKSAGKFPTKCDYGLNFSRIFCFTCNVQETSFLQKCRKFSYKMFSWYKFERYCHYIEHVGNFPTKCRKISYRWILEQENFLHTSVKCCISAGKFPTHTVKIWIFLSSAGTWFLHFNLQIKVHLATDYHFLFLLEHVVYGYMIYYQSRFESCQCSLTGLNPVNAVWQVWPLALTYKPGMYDCTSSSYKLHSHVLCG